jgi:hypothetical protein
MIMNERHVAQKKREGQLFFDAIEVIYGIHIREK